MTRSDFHTTLNLDGLRDADAVAAPIRAALARHKLVMVPHDAASAPRGRDFWEAVNVCIGDKDMRGNDTVAGDRLPSGWWDIRYDPALATAYRHSNTLQPLHTDGAFNLLPHDCTAFYCERQAQSGGASFFVDAGDICDWLAQASPDLLRRLTTIPVYFARGTNPGQRTPIIRHDAAGPIINWNFYRVEPSQGAEVLQLRDDFQAALHQHYVEGRCYHAIRMQPGDALFFHDQRVLHGREGFPAEKAGDRIILTMNLNLHDAAVFRGAAAPAFT